MILGSRKVVIRAALAVLGLVAAACSVAGSAETDTNAAATVTPTGADRGIVDVLATSEPASLGAAANGEPGTGLDQRVEDSPASDARSNGPAGDVFSRISELANTSANSAVAPSTVLEADTRELLSGRAVVDEIGTSASASGTADGSLLGGAGFLGIEAGSAAAELARNHGATNRASNGQDVPLVGGFGPPPSQVDERSAAAGDLPRGVDSGNFDGSLLELPSTPRAFLDVQPHQSCVASPEDTLTDAPAWVTNSLTAAVNHPDFANLDVSVSVWIDGWGEVVTRDPDLALVPASNEKILVAHAANERIDPARTLDTTIERVGADLVLRAAGDPTFSTWRANQLIEQVVAAGVTSVDRLIIDVSAFPQPSAAPGWQSWQIRNFVGPLSGFMLDDNRWNTSDEFLETPALVNGEWLAGALRNSGVAVNSVEIGAPPAGTVVGVTQSAPVGTLIRDMMLFSDNQVADMLVLQLGLINGAGTLEDGIAQIERELSELCVPLAGVMDDGSGLSRSNFRSAREFQEILRAIRNSETAEVFESQLPIGGVSGTLRRRFGGDPGRVQAKTGTIFGGRALSGYAVTDSGRDVVFSILINGDREQTSASLGALDALVRTILRA